MCGMQETMSGDSKMKFLWAVLSFSFTLSISGAGAWGAVIDSSNLTHEDIVFVEMDVDKHEVYQGEPILLRMRLWRIKYPQINSGPYRGGHIVNPTTEGFYVQKLAPEPYEAMRGPWTYDVAEARMLLYPTRSGDLQIGAWHWEGIALINRRSITERDKRYYKLDVGPIYINVKQLPEPAPGFTGAVGEFDVSASIDTESLAQGDPVKFLVTVQGSGNPEIIGAPALPEMAWASVSDPETTVHFFEGTEQMAKYFTYTLTPVKGAAATVPSFDFVYFSPEKRGYIRKPIGPFELNVP